MKKYALLAVFSGILTFLVSCQKDEIESIALTYDINMPQDNNYTRFNQTIDSTAITNAFNISFNDFKKTVGTNDTSMVHYYALNADGTINETKPTTLGLGHWFNAKGETSIWGKNAVLFSEFNEQFQFEIGQYPGSTAIGDAFTIKQGFMYNGAMASITFNITITND